MAPAPLPARLLTVSAALLLSGAAAARGSWVALANPAPVPNAGVALLLPDGTVIVLGDGSDNDGIGDVWHRLTPDASGSYVNGTWSDIAPMIDTREYFSSQVLRDGRVYVAGGEYGTGKTKAEVYDPVADTWTQAADPASTLSDANSELLPDGRVLQALVSGNLRKTKIWDPVTDTYVAGPQCLGIHNESVWIKLPDDSILFVDRNATSSERWLPSTGTWVADSTVPVSLYDPWGLETGAAVLLPDGRAFFIGSPNTTAFYDPSGGAAPGIWKAGPAPPGGRGAPDAPMAMLVDGKVLCVLSPQPTPANHFPSPSTFFEYDPAINVFKTLPAPDGGASIDDPCYTFCFLALPDGSVLCGHQGSSSYHVFVPDGETTLTGRAAVTGIGKLGASSVMLGGTGFNGISQGASYGDDWQMSTNYPLVRFTHPSGSPVLYGRTHDWNLTGVATGSTPCHVTLELPAGLSAGTWSLEVVTNGIASAPVPFVVSAAGCPADLNADGAVNGADLGLLLANWNGAGVGDLDGSGAVDGGDLGILLAGWGACPP